MRKSPEQGNVTCRSPQNPIVSSPRKTPEEGTESGEAQRSVVPPRQPLVVGALAVMLIASSINEVKLGVPAVSIRLGLQVWRSVVCASCAMHQGIQLTAIAADGEPEIVNSASVSL
jgi:hypothetical protein